MATERQRVPPHIEVDIWADISCPWCYIGRRSFELGLAGFEHADMVRVNYRSYVLNPDAPHDFDGSAREFLVRHKGVPEDQVGQMVAQVQRRAEEVGLVYDIDKLRITNTIKAHEVLHVAKRQNLQLELVERFFTAFFAEGRDLGSDDGLADLATEVGLDRGGVLAALSSGECCAAVDADIVEARERGVTGVPFYLFNDACGVSGAQAPDTFTSVLRELYDKGLDDGDPRM